MLRGYLHFRRNLAIASIAALALCVGLAITAPTPAFADDISTDTSASGGSDAGAGAAGQGSVSAGMSSTTTTESTSDDDGGAANANTGAGAGASQNGDDGSTSANAGTQATAGVTADGTHLTADASANADAGGTSQTDNGLGLADLESEAKAHAENGDTPLAYTSAGSDTWALAIGGENYSANAFAGTDSIIETRNGKYRTITIAYTKDGQYSVAIASPWRATAFSSTYGDGGAFTVDDIIAAAKTQARAYATAGKHDASAWASSRARGFGGNKYGVSAAASASRAGAHLSITIHKTPGSSSSGVGTASFVPGACTLTVSDWKKWKKLSLAERKKHVHCGCPPTQKVKFGQRLNSGKACGVTATLSGGTIRLGKKK